MRTPSPKRQHEGRLRPVDEEARRELRSTRAAARFLRRGDGIDAEDRADRDVDVDVRRAVERIDDDGDGAVRVAGRTSSSRSSVATNAAARAARARSEKRSSARRSSTFWPSPAALTVLCSAPRSPASAPCATMTRTARRRRPRGAWTTAGDVGGRAARPRGSRRASCRRPWHAPPCGVSGDAGIRSAGVVRKNYGRAGVAKGKFKILALRVRKN